MLLLDKTREYQSSLANYCRTGKYNTIPGVVEKNVGHYRRLVFNIIDGSLASAYPLTRQLLSDVVWDSLINRFFSNYNCKSPQVWYMPFEFYEYVCSEEYDLKKSYPFIESLLWFEWLEIEVYMMEDIKVEFSQHGDINNDRLILNPETKIISLDYPVHLKNALEITEADKNEYFVSVHREPDTGNVRFNDLSFAFARLLEILKASPVSFTHLVRKLGEDMNFEPDNNTIGLIKNFVSTSLKNRLIIGFRSK